MVRDLAWWKTPPKTQQNKGEEGNVRFPQKWYCIVPSRWELKKPPSRVVRGPAEASLSQHWKGVRHERDRMWPQTRISFYNRTAPSRRGASFDRLTVAGHSLRSGVTPGALSR